MLLLCANEAPTQRQRPNLNPSQERTLWAKCVVRKEGKRAGVNETSHINSEMPAPQAGTGGVAPSHGKRASTIKTHARAVKKRVRDEDGPKAAKAQSSSKRVRVPDYTQPQDSGLGEDSGELEYADTGPPKHLHALLKYGPKPLSRVERCGLKYVLDHCVIPDDFPQSKRYGPLSGMSHEGRVLAAYSARLLELKDPARGWGATAICLICGAEGHVKRECPAAF
jgi:hypothetical protein